VVFIRYLQRTASRYQTDTEARLTKAMAEQAALREFTVEGAWCGWQQQQQ
jgi:hypothetical protein